MVISTAACLALQGAIQAQAPPAVPVINSTPTQWSPYPKPPVVETRPLPQLTPLLLPDEANGAVPAKVLTFQKPVGGTEPQQGGVLAEPVSQNQPGNTPKNQPGDPGTLKDKVPDNDFPIPLDYTGQAPGREIVFRLESDQQLDNRIMKELNPNQDKNLKFPTSSPLIPPGTVYQPKTVGYSPTRALLEPHYVVHRRLYFEEKNTERAGWDAGALQPIVSAAYFYKDVAFLPHKFATGLLRDRYDASSGKCMPGDPTPYYLYPPGYSVSGSLFEAGVITGLAFIIP